MSDTSIELQCTVQSQKDQVNEPNHLVLVCKAPDGKKGDVLRIPTSYFERYGITFQPDDEVVMRVDVLSRVYHERRKIEPPGR